MTFPELSRVLAIALLLMRLMVGGIFLTSGWNCLPNELCQFRTHIIQDAMKNSFGKRFI
jgi:hypothetical protein